MDTKVCNEFKLSCSKCREVTWVEDEGQHITLFTCQSCEQGNEVRHRPDPAPLPPAIHNRRVDVIHSLLDSFTRAALLFPVKRELAWAPHAHQSAQDTANYLFGYQGRKTIMIGRKKASAAIAPM